MLSSLVQNIMQTDLNGPKQVLLLEQKERVFENLFPLQFVNIGIASNSLYLIGRSWHTETDDTRPADGLAEGIK
jgi:hypothetical protein